MYDVSKLIDKYVSIVAIFELEYEGDDGVCGDGCDEVVLEGVEALGLLFEEVIEEGMDGLESFGVDGSFELMKGDEPFEIVDDGVVVVERDDRVGM